MRYTQQNRGIYRDGHLAFTVENGKQKEIDCIILALNEMDRKESAKRWEAAGLSEPTEKQ